MFFTLLLNFVNQDVSINSLALLGSVVIVHIYHMFVA